MHVFKCLLTNKILSHNEKKLFIPFLLLSYNATFSQVGVNTNEPKATLDVVGQASESSISDGIIPP